MPTEETMAGPRGDAEAADRRLDQLDAFSEEVAQRSLRLLLRDEEAVKVPRPRDVVTRRDSE